MHPERQGNKAKGKGTSQQAPSLYARPSTPGWSGGSWSSSRGSWQAAASAWAASSWRGAEGTTTTTRERATGAVAEVQPWTGSCRPEYLLTSRDLGRLEIPPILLFIVTCFMFLRILLIFGSPYLFWSWRHYKEKASQRAERIRELQDLQKLHEEIIQSMEEEAPADQCAPPISCTKPTRCGGMSRLAA